MALLAVQVIEQSSKQALVEWNNGLRSYVNFKREISENAVLNWNGLSVGEIYKIVQYHNEKGFY